MPCWFYRSLVIVVPVHQTRYKAPESSRTLTEMSLSDVVVGSRWSRAYRTIRLSYFAYHYYIATLTIVIIIIKFFNKS